ncbi:hypothetical protein BDW68DRAFT_188759 [Aspergillus falconensis]
MHLSPWIFSLFTTAMAATLQVNYYSDGGCTDYMTSINPGTSCCGAAQQVVYPEDNCASNWGRGFYSMKCSVEHEL